MKKRIVKIDDATLFKFFDDIQLVFGDTTLNETFSLVPGIELQRSEYPILNAVGRRSINSAILNFNDGSRSFRFSFSRDITDHNNHQTPSLYFDEIMLSFGPNASTWRSQTDVIMELNSVIDKVSVGAVDVGSNSNSDVLNTLIVGFGQSHERMLTALNAALLDSEARRVALESENATQMHEIKNQHERSLADLEEKKANLQLQSHMAARRTALKDLAAQAIGDAKSVQLPSGANQMRWAVFLTALIMACFAAVYSVTSIIAINPNVQSPLDWLLLAKSILGGIVSIGALVYAATWMRGFYQADLHAARELEKFNYDLNRANWIIETILEVHHEAKGEVPQAWIDGVTRGLFESGKNNHNADDGAQALGALLGYSASASFGSDGPRFELNGKGTKKLAESLKDGGA